MTTAHVILSETRSASTVTEVNSVNVQAAPSAFVKILVFANVSLTFLRSWLFFPLAIMLSAPSNDPIPIALSAFPQSLHQLSFFFSLSLSTSYIFPSHTPASPHPFTSVHRLFCNHLRTFVAWLGFAVTSNPPESSGEHFATSSLPRSPKDSVIDPFKESFSACSIEKKEKTTPEYGSFPTSVNYRPHSATAPILQSGCA